MRASSVFALTLAVLIGLGAVIGARYAGWLNRIEQPKKEVKEVAVLVTARNIFPGDVIEQAWVKTRPMRPEELVHYNANKEKYLPAVPAAAVLRVANKPIEADAPILREDLTELKKPEALHERLMPNMRAINLSLQRDQCAGGLIQVGEWVDVYLTSTITAENGLETTRTAAVATKLRIIAKRGSLWNLLAALPEGKPVQYAVEANPYRAALLEFAKNKGTLSIAALSAAEQKRLEQRRNEWLDKNAAVKLLPISFAEPGNEEIDAEATRIEGLQRGEYTIGSGDLIRLFDLHTPPPPMQPTPTTPPTPTPTTPPAPKVLPEPLPETSVEQFSGLKRTRTTYFSADGSYAGSEEPRTARANAKREMAAQKATIEAANKAAQKEAETALKEAQKLAQKDAQKEALAASKAKANTKNSSGIEGFQFNAPGCGPRPGGCKSCAKKSS
jgi:Flp pilus assembly protein CpaB